MTQLKSHLKSLSRNDSQRPRIDPVKITQRIGRVYLFATCLVTCCVQLESTFAQTNEDSDKKATATVSTQTPKDKPGKVSAREAVRLGNQQLIAGDADGALQHYTEAEQLEPDAPQIAYVKGLGYFAAEDYSEARQAFEKAAASDNEKIAGDALYGAGITYHAEALAALDDPKAAIGKLESALERYRTVLAHEPDHQAAKDAGLKAATLRRQLVQQAQQQESESCDNPKESDEENEDEEKQKKDGNQSDEQDEKKDQEKQDQQQEGDEQEEQQDQQSSQDDEPQSEESQQQESKDSDEQQQSDSSKQEESSNEKQQQAKQAKENAEDDKKEQAQRRLREMMDAMRNRKKRRPNQPLPTPIKPVDKDW